MTEYSWLFSRQKHEIFSTEISRHALVALLLDAHGSFLTAVEAVDWRS